MTVPAGEEIPINTRQLCIMAVFCLQEIEQNLPLEPLPETANPQATPIDTPKRIWVTQTSKCIIYTKKGSVTWPRRVFM